MCPETLEEFPIADGGDELHEVERFEVRGSFEPFFFSNVFRLVFDIDVRFVDDDQIKSGRKGLELRWNVLILVDSAGMHGSSLRYRDPYGLWIEDQANGFLFAEIGD